VSIKWILEGLKIISTNIEGIDAPGKIYFEVLTKRVSTMNVWVEQYYNGLDLGER